MMINAVKHTVCAWGVRAGRHPTVNQELGGHDTRIGPGCVPGKSGTFSNVAIRCNIKRAPHACVENWFLLILVLVIKTEKD